MASVNEKLFSYGTLRFQNVQQASFGRTLEGNADKIKGYKLEEIEITDFDVISKSGKSHHKIMVHTGNDADLVEGIVFEVTKDELKMADHYEVDDYKRVKIPTLSGEEVWAYVAAN